MTKPASNLQVSAICSQCPELIGNKQTDTNSSFQAGWDAAKARLQETNFLMEPEEVNELMGEIASVSNNQFELKINPLYPLLDPDLDLRKIKIDAQTEIYLLKQKDFEEYEKEMNIYDAKMNAMLKQENADLSILGSPPDFYNKEKTSISDLQNNQNIRVIADMNIKDSKEFIAKEILIEVDSGNLNIVVDSAFDGTGSLIL